MWLVILLSCLGTSCMFGLGIISYYLYQKYKEMLVLKRRAEFALESFEEFQSLQQTYQEYAKILAQCLVGFGLGYMGMSTLNNLGSMDGVLKNCLDILQKLVTNTINNNQYNNNLHGLNNNLADMNLHNKNLFAGLKPFPKPFKNYNDDEDMSCPGESYYNKFLGKKHLDQSVSHGLEGILGQSGQTGPIDISNVVWKTYKTKPGDKPAENPTEGENIEMEI